MQNTLIMIKPNNGEDIPRSIAMDVVNELRLNLVSIVTFQPTSNLMEEFYAEHKGKDFFNDLIKYVTSGPAYIYFIKGDDAINKIRTKLGSTDPANAEENTWRKKYGKSILENIAHASSDEGAYKHESNTIIKFIVD